MSLSLRGAGVKQVKEYALTKRLAGELPGPGPLLAAVSGGSDSVALLRILHHLAPKQGWDLIVGHVDHQLRPDSAQDAEFVARLASKLGLAFLERRVEVQQGGRSPEEAARLARHQALAEMADQAGAKLIAMGHTADDQAETLLGRILSGTGPTGLAGIRVLRGNLWRPLLALTRQELRDYLRSLGQEFRDDPSNQGLDPMRNRVRHRLLPLARELVNPRSDQALCRLASLAADEELHWQALCREFLAGHCRAQGTSLCLETNAFARKDRALQRRLLRYLLADLAGNGQGPDLESLERLRGIALGQAGRETTLSGGIWAGKEAELLRVDTCKYPQDFQAELPEPGRLPLPQIGHVLSAELAQPPEKLSAGGPAAWLPLEEVSWPLCIRSPRPGERIHPLGAPGSKKISHLLIDRKAPAWWRRRTVLVCDQRGILWAAPWAQSERTRKKGTKSDWLCLRLIDTPPTRPYTQNPIK